MAKVRIVLVEAWLPIVVVVVWWLVSANSTSLYFPPLSKILKSFNDMWIFDRVQSDLVPTVITLLIGVGLATLAGLLLGLVLGFIEPVRLVLNPFLQLAWSVPKLAVLPIFIAVMGIGLKMQITFVVVGTLWPVLLGTMSGIAGVDSEVVDTARSYRLPGLLRLTHVFLPAAAPEILAGLRTSLQLGIGLVIISEMVASTRGVGFFILQSQQTYNIPDMWSGVILLGIVGYVLNLLLRALESVVLRWHRGRAQASR